MEFKTKQIVFQESGENWGTLCPVCFLEDFTGDITAKTTRFVSWDNDQKIEVDLYQVKELTVPVISDLFKDFNRVKFAVGLAGIEALQSLSESQFLNMLDYLSQYEKYAFGRLYALRKNEFCASLFNQLVEHLEKPKYKHPFSEAQLKALLKFRIYPLEAERLSTAIYNRLF